MGTPSTTDPLDVGAVPTAVTPPWIPVFTGKTRWQPSFRPPSRYPPPNRLTAPRCGIHGGARVGTPSTTDPLDVGAVPSLPHHHGYRRPPYPSSPTHPQPSFRPPSRYPPPNRHIAPRSGTHPSLVVPHPDPVPTPPSSYRTPTRYPPPNRHIAPRPGTHPPTVFPPPKPVPTPPSSYRTPMRYPWWGKGGDPFDYRPARRWRSPHRRHTTMDTGFHR